MRVPKFSKLMSPVIPSRPILIKALETRAGNNHGNRTGNSYEREAGKKKSTGFSTVQRNRREGTRQPEASLQRENQKISPASRDMCWIKNPDAVKDGFNALGIAAPLELKHGVG